MKVNAMTPMLKTIATIFAAACLATVAHAKDAPPDRLTIGYENEGKIDASHTGCLAYVKETTEWSKAETEEGAKRVCPSQCECLPFLLCEGFGQNQKPIKRIRKAQPTGDPKR